MHFISQLHWAFLALQFSFWFIEVLIDFVFVPSIIYFIELIFVNHHLIVSSLIVRLCSQLGSFRLRLVSFKTLFMVIFNCSPTLPIRIPACNFLMNWRVFNWRQFCLRKFILLPQFLAAAPRPPIKLMTDLKLDLFHLSCCSWCSSGCLKDLSPTIN